MAFKYEETRLVETMSIIQAEEPCLTNEENNDIFAEFEKEELAHHLPLAIQTYQNSCGN